MLNRENGKLKYQLDVTQKQVVLLESALKAARRPPLTGPESVDALLRLPNDPSV